MCSIIRVIRCGKVSVIRVTRCSVVSVSRERISLRLGFSLPLCMVEPIAKSKTIPLVTVVSISLRRSSGNDCYKGKYQDLRVNEFLDTVKAKGGQLTVFIFLLRSLQQTVCSSPKLLYHCCFSTGVSALNTFWISRERACTRRHSKTYIHRCMSSGFYCPLWIREAIPFKNWMSFTQR